MQAIDDDSRRVSCVEREGERVREEREMVRNVGEGVFLLFRFCHIIHRIAFTARGTPSLTQISPLSLSSPLSSHSQVNVYAATHGR
jgi:hypothetical protein